MIILSETRCLRDELGFFELAVASHRDSESHMQIEQQQVIARLNKVNLPVRILGGASGLLILVIAGMWIYEGLSRVQ